MSVGHEIWDAVPPTGAGAADKTKLRNTVTARMPYVLADDDNPADLVCVDPLTGSAIRDILFQGRTFHYDPTDLVTEGDGVTVIVSFEGRRYKLTDGSDVIAYSVLDNDLTAPPDDAEQGDAHLVAVGATGDWAGMDGRVAVLTTRGWVFVIFGIGRAIYVESLDAYYHRKSTGEWVVGLGNLTIGPQSVPLSATINFGNRIIVENQTTNSPPGTATVGTAYVIGSGATGDWSGKALKVAICEVANTFTVYAPSPGWSIYDRALKSSFTWNGTAWLSTAGTWIDRASISTVSGSTTSPIGSSGYLYSSSTAPTTSQRQLTDDASLAFAAKKTGAKLRVSYKSDLVWLISGTGSSVRDGLCLAIFRDAESNAIDWAKVPVVGGLVTNLASAFSSNQFSDHIAESFEIAAPDTNSHTYKIGIMSAFFTGALNIEASSLTRRLLEIEESA